MHAGFQEAADQVWPALKKLLEEQGPGVHLDLTGHSLGAAIAEEIAMRVHDQLGDKVVIDGVYPFEPPNMYDRKAAEAYDREGSAAAPARGAHRQHRQRRGDGDLQPR